MRASVATGALALAGIAGPAALAEEASPFGVETVASGLDYPWSVAFLPDGGLLVTELTGQLRVVRDGTVSEPVAGVPEVLFGGQGGLSDVVLHPDFAENNLVYLTWSGATDKGNTLFVGRGTFTGDALEGFETIFEADAYRTTRVHYGARLAFLPDGTFVVASGDGFDYRENAQMLDDHFGTTLRLNADGTVPSDNPFTDDADALDEIYTYGHRNQQAVVYDAANDALYLHEHGPQGGDEINVLEPGANYGWPLATFGVDYSGAYISPHTEYEGTVQPLHQWTPSIAPAGMAIYRGDAFADWDGDLLVTALAPGNVAAYADRNLRRIDLENGEVVADIPLRVAVPGDEAGTTARLRDVRVAPDGSVFVLTDGEGGEILRLTPEGGMPAPEPAPLPEEAAAAEPGGGALEDAADTARRVETGVEDLAEEAAGEASGAVEEAAEEAADMAEEAAEKVAGEAETIVEDAAEDAALDEPEGDAAP